MMGECRDLGRQIADKLHLGYARNLLLQIHFPPISFLLYVSKRLTCMDCFNRIFCPLASSQVQPLKALAGDWRGGENEVKMFVFTAPPVVVACLPLPKATGPARCPLLQFLQLPPLSPVPSNCSLPCPLRCSRGNGSQLLLAPGVHHIPLLESPTSAHTFNKALLSEGNTVPYIGSSKICQRK